MGRCMTARRAAQGEVWRDVRPSPRYSRHSDAVQYSKFAAATGGKLLRDCLACDDETVEKLLPLFREDARASQGFPNYRIVSKQLQLEAGDKAERISAGKGLKARCVR